MRTNWPARGLLARSSASFEATVISPVERTMTRQLFGSRIAPSRAARNLPPPLLRLYIAARTTAPPYARDGLQQRCLAPARLTMKMDPAALLSGQMQQRPGQRRRYGENGQDMTPRQRSDAGLPVFNESARPIWPMRRAVEKDGRRT